MQPHGFIFTETLSLLRKPLHIRSLAQLSGRDLADALLILRGLEQKGFCRAEGDYWETAGRKNADAPVDAALRGLILSGSDPYARALLLLRDGDILAGCESLLEAIRHLIHEALSPAVLVCLDILIAVLPRWRFKDHSTEESLRYIAVFIQAQGVSMYTAKRVDEALALFPHARAVADGVGSERAALQLDLAKACQLHLTRSHNTEEPHALLRRTMEGIKNLDDRDIQAGTAYGTGLLHFMRAEFTESIRCLRQVPETPFTTKFNYYDEMSLRNIAGASSHLAAFDLTLGSMTNALRNAELRGDKLAVKWGRVTLGDMLLRAGLPDFALEYLDKGLPCCDPESETRLWFWGMRALAYYHFQMGRMDISRRLLHRALEIGERYGLCRPFYAFPWLLDMLWAYEERRLPPIPGYDIDQELDAALRGQNAQLHGAALRILALRRLGSQPQLKNGEEREKVFELLRQSLDMGKRVGNPLEEARACIALSRALRAAGGCPDEASALYERGRAILAAYRQYDCPPPLPGTENVILSARVPDPAACLERFRAALEEREGEGDGPEERHDWSSFEERLQYIVDSARDALEVERMALFRLENGRLELAASRHISREEAESDSFRPYREKLARRFGEQRPFTLAAEQGAALCLPLPLPGGESWLLFMECLYLPERITGQNMSLFRQLSELLRIELRIVLQLRRRLATARKRGEERARLAAVRLDDAEGLYYGPSMLDTLRQADRAAPTDAPALIVGETGVGKEMLARRLHAYSGRAGPCVVVHPASIPEGLFESEMLGHEKGAFTSAIRQKIGLVELADTGTLFIDELGDIPLALQVKLLRLLQEKRFMRVGGTKEIASDFRLITATNQDLRHMIREGRFREDLYYRVAVVPLRIPPLRQRIDDIPYLAQLFMDRFTSRYQRPRHVLNEEEKLRLKAYPWPGNVRELKNVMERTVILNRGELALAPQTSSDAREGLPGRSSDSPDDSGALTPVPPANAGAPVRAREVPVDSLWGDLPSMEELQRRYIEHVLEVTRGRIDGERGARAILGMKRSTLYEKIRRYHLDPASRLYGPEGHSE